MQRIQVYNNVGLVKNETSGRDARGFKVLENCTTSFARWWGVGGGGVRFQWKPRVWGRQHACAFRGLARFLARDLVLLPKSSGHNPKSLLAQLWPLKVYGLGFWVLGSIILKKAPLVLLA